MILAQIPDAMLEGDQLGASRVVYELGRLREFDDLRLPVTLIALGTAAIVLLVWYLYRRDTRELPRGVGLMLAGLRFVALAGLLVFFLGIERRTSHEVVNNSQRCEPSEPRRPGCRRAGEDAARERVATASRCELLAVRPDSATSRVVAEGHGPTQT
jgi:hypothetical protein